MADPPVRVLLLSNNPLRNTGSNGRTLLGLLGAIAPQDLAQFYISSQLPDEGTVGGYLQLTDRDAVHLALTGHMTVVPPGTTERHPPRATAKLPPSAPHRPRRTPFKLALREFVWALAIRRGWKQITRFIDEFSPDVVLIQAGDSAFMLALAQRIARFADLPIVVFNSEDYFFKKHNYLDGSRLQLPIYKLWHRHLRRAIAATFGAADHIIYSCKPLEMTFQSAIPTISSTVLTPSSIKPRVLGHQALVERFVYAGNLGLGRFRVLANMARILATAQPSARIVVYGPPLEPEDEALAAAVPNLYYRGFRPYTEVVTEMRESDVILHVESFEPSIRRDTVHAFSTKIADCLASGTPLLMYGPPEIASTKYLREHEVAVVASTPEELLSGLRRVLDIQVRTDLARRALAVAARNHDPAINQARVCDILEQTATRPPGTRR